MKGVYMATSSITKNFIISGQKQADKFADAIEASANDKTPRSDVRTIKGALSKGLFEVVNFVATTRRWY